VTGLGVNAAIWRWAEPYGTSSKRRRLHTKMDDVHDAIMDGGTHAAQAEFDQGSFVADLEEELGPQAPEGDWLAEFYDRSVVINMPNSVAIEWLPRIQGVANRHDLNVAAHL
jgi:hypothetical protein